MIISSLPQGVQGQYGHIIPLTPLVLIPWHSIFVYTEYSTDDYSNCVLAYTTGRADIVYTDTRSQMRSELTQAGSA